MSANYDCAICGGSVEGTPDYVQFALPLKEMRPPPPHLRLVAHKNCADANPSGPPQEVQRSWRDDVERWEAENVP